MDRMQIHKNSNRHEKENGYCMLRWDRSAWGLEWYTDVSFSPHQHSICVETNVSWRQLRIRGCIGAYVLISCHAQTFLHLFLLPEFFWTKISGFPTICCSGFFWTLSPDPGLELPLKAWHPRRSTCSERLHKSSHDDLQKHHYHSQHQAQWACA